MKLIDAEFIVHKKMNGDPVTEEEWLAAGRHYRMRSRYLMTWTERTHPAARELAAGSELDSLSMGLIRGTTKLLDQFTDALTIWKAFWPGMEPAWGDLERRAFTLYEKYAKILGRAEE